HLGNQHSRALPPDTAGRCQGPKSSRHLPAFTVGPTGMTVFLVPCRRMSRRFVAACFVVQANARGGASLVPRPLDPLISVRSVFVVTAFMRSAFQRKKSLHRTA